MAISLKDIENHVILKSDIYHNKTLLLRKGSVLNSYLLQKLKNFGIEEILDEIKGGESLSLNNKIMIFCSNDLEKARTRRVLEFAGFKSGDFIFANSDNFLQVLEKNYFKYIFIDNIFFNENFVHNVLLGLIKNKISIFVLNCDREKTTNIPYNTDFLKINFLYKPLASGYINALLKLYS